MRGSRRHDHTRNRNRYDTFLSYLLRGFTLALLREHVGEAALPAVLSIEMRGHECAWTAPGIGAHTPQARDLSVAINLVVFQHGELDLVMEAAGKWNSG